MLITEKYKKAEKYLDSPPVKLLPIAKELGVDVFRVKNWPDKLSGMIKKGEDGKYNIFLNASHSENRRRFTLAHELAHLILHEDKIGDGIIDDAMYRSGFTNAIETEANDLAANLLMPKSLVKTKIEEIGIKDINALADAFKVSKDAMRVRLKNISPNLIYDD